MRHPGGVLRASWRGCVLTAFAAGAAIAAPHIPVDDREVVETLPVRFDPELSALAGLRGAWLRNPADAASAEALVRAYIAAARRNGDPRFLGYAESVLARFDAGAAAASGAGAAAGAGPDSTAPIPLRVLHATVLQSLHRFDEALAVLTAVIDQQPHDAQALLTRATVLQVRGRYAEARHDCGQLWRAAGETTTALCLASVAAVTGGERAAAALAERALRSLRDNDQAGRTWALTLLAESALRAGDLAAAGNHFERALAADPTDRYARAAYCDLLLRRGEPQKVRNLTAGMLRDDNLLLRHALALQALANSGVRGSGVAPRDLQANIALLRERHAAARLRGDRTHLREEARLQLELLHDAGAALRLARENWAVQKEPADAELLLAAAHAAGDQVTLREVATWVRATGLHDSRIEGLLQTDRQVRG